MKRLIIATHDEMFHADEIFAICILKKIYPNIKIVRSRDPKILEKADIRIDVGAKYNFNTKDFDHHQANFNLKRKNGVPYSSCGLIWKHFGEKLVNSKIAFDYIENNLIQFIDCDDNGIDYSNGLVKVYSVAEVINSFNSSWKNLKEDQYKIFFAAMQVAEVVLDNELKKANEIVEGEKIVSNALKKSKDGFVVLPSARLPKNQIVGNKKIKCYIFPGPSSPNWLSVSVPVKTGSFSRSASFPESWAGLSGKDLEDVTGVKGAIFCHKKRFIVVADSKRSVLELTKKALKASQ